MQTVNLDTLASLKGVDGTRATICRLDAVFSDRQGPACFLCYTNKSKEEHVQPTCCLRAALLALRDLSRAAAVRHLVRHRLQGQGRAALGRGKSGDPLAPLPLLGGLGAFRLGCPPHPLIVVLLGEVDLDVLHRALRTAGVFLGEESGRGVHGALLALFRLLRSVPFKLGRCLTVKPWPEQRKRYHQLGGIGLLQDPNHRISATAMGWWLPLRAKFQTQPWTHFV